MRKLLVVMVALGLVGALVMAAPAGADVIYNLPWSYSPDSDWTSTTLETTDDVLINTWGSVLIGGGNILVPSGDTYFDNVYQAEVYYDWAYQPPGLFGVGVDLGQFSTATSFEVSFDAYFYSWDWVAEGEQFIAAITKGGQYWAGGAVQGTPWTWGGTDDWLNFTLDSLSLPYALQMTVDVAAANDYFLFVGLQTNTTWPDDSGLPSWGRFSDVTLTAVVPPPPPIPEPATLLLVGLGLLGLAGLRRKS
jgi:hypothetical protein